MDMPRATVGAVVISNEGKVFLNSEAQEHIWVWPEEGLLLPVDSLTRASLEALQKK